MAQLRIYQPRKNAMQSGRAGTRNWVAEYAPVKAKKVDGLMGWAGRSDTRNQVRLGFDSREEAIAYAERKGLDYRVTDSAERRVKPKSYADNFAHDRLGNWSH